MNTSVAHKKFITENFIPMVFLKYCDSRSVWDLKWTSQLQLLPHEKSVNLINREQRNRFRSADRVCRTSADSGWSKLIIGARSHRQQTAFGRFIADNILLIENEKGYRMHLRLSIFRLLSVSNGHLKSCNRTYAAPSIPSAETKNDKGTVTS